MYSNFRDLELTRKKKLSNFEGNREVRPAVIVTEGGSTTYDALGENWTWISYSNQLTLNRSPVWNPTTLKEEGTPVLVARQPKPPYRWEIIGANSAYEADGSDVPLGQFNVPPHSPSQQVLEESNPGPDPLYVAMPMMLPLKTEGDGASLTVTTYPYDYNYVGSSKYFAGKDTDLTSSVPGAGLVRNVLVYLDRVTGLLLTVEGATVIDDGITPIPTPLPPHADTTKSAWVTLANGQTTIDTADDVDDARDLFDAGSSATAVPTPTGPGQIFMSDDLSNPFWATPVIADLEDGGGWLMNEDGDFIVEG